MIRLGRCCVLLMLCFALSACGGDAESKADAAPTPSDVSSSTEVDPDTWGTAIDRPREERPAGVGTIKAGVAMRYIHGPVGVSMAGYGGRNKGRRTHWSDKLKGSAGFYGLQTIKVVALEVGTERMALVKSPLMSSESYMTDAIERHLKVDYDLDFQGRVITMAGHSHHTTARYWPIPNSLGGVGVDSFDAEVAERNAALFASAIADAWKGRQDAQWATATKENWDPKDEIYRDRRSSNDPAYGKDPLLRLLAFRRASDKTPLAVIINFPIHGIVFNDDNDMFTEDAPGYVEHKFEEFFYRQTGKPVFGMLAQAAGGDASPAGGDLKHPPMPRLERIGELAAPRIFELYKSLKWSAEAELAIRSMRIELTHERMYSAAPHAAKYGGEFANEFGDGYLWGGWQCAGSGVGEGETMEGKPKLCVDLGKLLSLLDSSIPHGEVNQVYLTAARLGNLWIMTLPGEPNYSLVKYAREEAQKRTWNAKPMELMVIGYSQDHLLYLLSPDDWFTGGYESTMSLWGPLGGVFLADRVFDLFDDMAAGFNGPTFFEESATLSAPALQWTPRAIERSKDSGQIDLQPQKTIARVDTARFDAVCGDPSLGAPHVVVQRKVNNSFEPVPSAHGWAGTSYDNSRYEMVSVYDPDPPQQDNKSVAERRHLWRFYWQVPAGWPTGDYRFSLACAGTDAQGEPQDLVMNSEPFAVGPAQSVTLTAVLEGQDVEVKWRTNGQAAVRSPADPVKGSWYIQGYRLLDRDTAHEGKALTRVDLKADILDANQAILATIDLPYDEQRDACVGKIPSEAATAVTLRAWIADDSAPAKVSSAIAKK